MSRVGSNWALTSEIQLSTFLLLLPLADRKQLQKRPSEREKTSAKKRAAVRTSFLAGCYFGNNASPLTSELVKRLTCSNEGYDPNESWFLSRDLAARWLGLSG